MKKQFQNAILLLLIFAAAWLLLDGGVRSTAEAGVRLCLGSVIPALFPFMVVSSLLMSMGFGEWLSGPLSGLMALYGIDGAGASALVLGLLGGYPLGARTAAELYRGQLLSKEETTRLLSFCNNVNPAFLITVLGTGVFGSFQAGLWLWLIHVAAALITGLILSGSHRRQRPAKNFRRAAFRAEKLSVAMVSAAESASKGTLKVCAFVLTFSILARPCQSLGGTGGILLSGLLELFSTIPLLTADRAGFMLAAGLAGWGGTSVLCQTAALLSDTDLPLWPCAAGKALQGILSAGLAALLADYVLG